MRKAKMRSASRSFAKQSLPQFIKPREYHQSGKYKISLSSWRKKGLLVTLENFEIVIFKCLQLFFIFLFSF